MNKKENTVIAMVRLNSFLRKDQKIAVKTIAKQMSVTEGDVVRQAVDLLIKKLNKNA